MMALKQLQTGLPSCRSCGAVLRQDFVDLGMTPLCESFLESAQLNAMEPFYPLHAYVCESCFLVQLEEYVSPESIFTEYAYFSSYSDAWLKHAEQYVDMAIERFGLSEKSHVVELASNDGYLLQYFVARQIPVLGIEPAANVAKAAEQRNVPTLVKFFGRETARQQHDGGKSADLIIGNNVLAQVPDLHDFVGGMKILLKPEGVITLEFPHLLQLMEQNQFDTIYHEHFSYFSAVAVDRVMQRHGLKFFDVEELWTHGGSLRVFVAHEENPVAKRTDRLNELLERERQVGLLELETYAQFSANVAATKRKLLRFLVDVKDAGKCVVGYGAPGKGNTLLNYCGIGTDFIDYIVDRNPYKHGRYTPGTHIPILEPATIMQTKPQYILILPWNLKDEIMEQLAPARAWGAQFVVPIPEVKVYS
jgi:2-polyprenyl-3-methyl-5-hydroxy-6-metoxy-1,4-benzoquinol methylase